LIDYLIYCKDNYQGDLQRKYETYGGTEINPSDTTIINYLLNNKTLNNDYPSWKFQETKFKDYLSTLNHNDISTLYEDNGGNVSSNPDDNTMIDFLINDKNAMAEYIYNKVNTQPWFSSFIKKAESKAEAKAEAQAKTKTTIRTTINPTDPLTNQIFIEQQNEKKFNTLMKKQNLTNKEYNLLYGYADNDDDKIYKIIEKKI
jgi:hypothetical protein